MNRIEPPLEPEPRHEINLGPKEARRVASYSPWFIWGVTAFWSAFIVVQLVVTGGDWLSALRFGAPGLFIGVVLGIRFRDWQ